jgi:hypothetical protein
LAIPIEVTTAPLSPFGVKNGPNCCSLHTGYQIAYSSKYGLYNVDVKGLVIEKHGPDNNIHNPKTMEKNIQWSYKTKLRLYSTEEADIK